jgi:FkbM family methyltransferase
MIHNKSPNLVAHSDYGPIIVNVFDIAIGQSILKKGFWADGDIELIKKICEQLLNYKKSLTFYDVGANIGTHTLAISKTFGDKVNIRAFEAQSSIFNMMCGTLALNNISNVKPHNFAVSNEDDKYLRFDLPDYNQNNNFGGFELLVPEKSDNQSMKRSGMSETIKTIRLDSFDEKVDFIKMDIEGMELLAIEGCVKILKYHRPCMFIEIIKTNKKKLYEILNENNYNIYLLKDDVLCMPKESRLKINGITPLKLS